jgi:ABC-2 type transport system permease protein
MDHLLVMPLTPFEIAMSKVWANELVITVAVGLSLYVVVRTILGIPIAGSIPLFMVGVVIYLFFATAIGIFLGTVARSMPQLGLLYMLVYLPMNMLSGANTPLESMPPWLATLMQASPSTHFVSFAQSILYRGAGMDVVWPQFVLVALIGGLFFFLAVLRFRSVTAPGDMRSDLPTRNARAVGASTPRAGVPAFAPSATSSGPNGRDRAVNLRPSAASSEKLSPPPSVTSTMIW